jgi:ADP-dependent phosphofructokinase/glucokinase
MIELFTDGGSFYITAEMLDAEFDRRREERKKEKRRQQNRIYYLQRKERLKQQAQTPVPAGQRLVPVPDKTDVNS